MSKFYRPLSNGFTVSCLLFSQFLMVGAQAEVLWDNWYTVTESGKPDSYYNEKAEIIQDKAKVQVNSWIKDGASIRIENLGATAKNTPLLEPLLYNFHSQGLGAEKTLDGSILNNGKIFSVKVKRGNQSGVAPLRAEMLPKLILASFFPVWVNKNYKRITGVQPISFQAIVEDQVEETVPVVNGDAYEMKADEFSIQSKTRKLRISFNRIVAFWYVTPKGDALKITIPSLNKVVEKVDRSVAEKFLEAKK